MSGQMYLGGKLQKKNCRVCLYNAFISDKIQQLKEDGEYVGCDTLAQVSKEVSESGEWKHLSVKEEEELLEHMEDMQDEKSTKKVTGKDVATDVEHTMACVQTELVGLEKCTGCNIMWILMHGKVGNSFLPHTYASQPLQTAFLHLCKSTVKSIGMQVDAYVVSGASGVVKMITGRKTIELKGEIH
ncbi:hypothetical protein DFH29DRAFT_1007063 [Suillus ampliporus]|nr:hypothetical protein DFH29DRAFT_1007063 [Suillus ampliporus]